MSTRPTLFSVIVTCYNGDKFIGDCLESVLRQEYDPGSFEVICIDDGSTDRSREIIERYAKEFDHLSSERIRNSGLEKACNHGIRLAKYERIVRVDSDDMLDRKFLQVMDRAVQSQPDYDFYYCKHYVEYYSQEKQYSRELPEFEPEEIFQRGDFFATGTVYKRADLAEVGFFPEQIKNCGLENYTVILELLRRHKRGLAVPNASFYYRRHNTNMSTLKRDEIIEYGRKLLARHGRQFQTNQFHPYGLRIGANVG